jgi:outer membrane protein OmpA-like peptidoglycan-associated protein
MAKKSLFEKLGLVEGVAASEYDMPDTTNELRVCSGVGDHYINGDFPEDEPVQVEVPEGDTIDVRAVYETNGMNPADAVTVYKIKDVIDTFPSEMPTKTKRATVKNLMTTLGYDAAAIISDAKQRKELLRAVGNDKMNALFDEMKSNDQQIESMKEQIEALTNRNVEAGAAIEKMASWKDNYNILNDTAPMIYNQMCDIWEALGESVNRDLVNTIFDTTYIDALKGDFKSTSAANATTKVTVSDEIRANITQQVTDNLDYDSMLSKTANVTFVPDSSVFTDQASAASVLNDFVNIAKTLDGTMIVINGNINADNQTDVGKQLSANRAQTVANYLASQGIDQNRLIITGSGNAKYQADKAAGTLSSDASVYQSTDISFLRIEN